MAVGRPPEAETFESFLEAGGLFMWVNTSGRPCPAPLGGCEARNEVSSTIADWIARGLPRTGWSVCGHRCHCILVPMLDFGLDIAEPLLTGDPGNKMNTSDVEPPDHTWTPDNLFIDMESLDPEEFVDIVEAMPLVGRTRELMDQMIQDFRGTPGDPMDPGRLTFDEAKSVADNILLGLG